MGIIAGAIISGAMIGWIGQSPVLEQFLNQAIWRTPPQEVFRRDDLTILILGCDRELAPGGKVVKAEKARSDLMMVARLNFVTGQISGFTIPRDTQAADPEHGTHKINAFSKLGGPALAERVVEDTFGITIDRVIDLNYVAFVDAVNILGGVRINVPKRMKKTDRAGGLYIDLQPGEQTLSGYDAMGFARYRSDSDFERQKRQRQMMIALKERMMERPGSLPQLADKLAELFGGALTDGEIASLAAFVQRIDSRQILLGQIPVRTRRRSTYLDLDTEQLPEFLDRHFFNPPLAEIPDQEPKAGKGSQS
jgi:LCP family protein required for cell wall assembly